MEYGEAASQFFEQIMGGGELVSMGVMHDHVMAVWHGLVSLYN